MSDKKKNNVVSFSEAAALSAKKQEKEKELEFYYRHLDMSLQKQAFIEMDIKVTKEIIDMIENETVVLVDDSVPIIEIDDDDYDPFE